MCNLECLKHYSKPYYADFFFVKIDRMVTLMFCYIFNEITKPREIIKTPSYKFWRYSWDIMRSWCCVIMKICELSPCNGKKINRISYDIIMVLAPLKKTTKNTVPSDVGIKDRRRHNIHCDVTTSVVSFIDSKDGKAVFSDSSFYYDSTLCTFTCSRGWYCNKMAPAGERELLWIVYVLRRISAGLIFSRSHWLEMFETQKRSEWTGALRIPYYAWHQWRNHLHSYYHQRQQQCGRRLKAWRTLIYKKRTF